MTMRPTPSWWMSERASRRLAGFAAALLSSFAPGWLAGPPTALAQQSPFDSRDTNPAAPEVGPFVGPPAPYPAITLGCRVLAEDNRAKVLSTLVLVPDEISYLAAIAAWHVAEDGSQTRFPVLIDDGTHGAEQQIARFVRAFDPRRVVRFKAAAEPLSDKPLERRAAFEKVLGTVWGAPGGKPEDLKKRFGALGFTPFGVVAAWPSDPAWTAAIALAAARGQPILWLEPRGGGLDSWVGIQEAITFGNQVNEQVKQFGYTYEEPGDEIQAVCLCMSMAGKVYYGEEEPSKTRFRALTDFVGRTFSTAKGKAYSLRWGWASQIVGDQPTAAYDAMSALFTKWWDRAWLVDGYNSSAPWVNYDMTVVSRVLAKQGVDIILDDSSGGVGVDDVRRRASGTRMGSTQPLGSSSPGMGMDATFFAVNTKGMEDFFELHPGLGRPDDIPLFRRPFAAYVVHSWSARYPSQRSTIAGMCLERGAFAYIGSVDEPTLQGFTPTPIFANRLVANIPWGAVGRQDADPRHPENDVPWKIAVFGDPLATLGSSPERVDEAPALPGLRNVADEVPEALKSRDFAAALRTLTILGRDKDAQRLLSALIRENPAAATPEVVLAGISAAFFLGDVDTLFAGVRILKPVLEDAPRVSREKMAEVRDMLWHATWPLQNTLSDPEGDLLAHMLRPESLARDAEEAARVVERHGGTIGSRGDVIERARGMTKDEALREELRKLRR